MTDLVAIAEMADALSRCSFPPYTSAKRCARQFSEILGSGHELSPPQQLYLLRLVVKYRRQISGEVVAAARASIPAAEKSAAAFKADMGARKAIKKIEAGVGVFSRVMERDRKGRIPGTPIAEWPNE